MLCIKGLRVGASGTVLSHREVLLIPSPLGAHRRGGMIQSALSVQVSAWKSLDRTRKRFARDTCRQFTSDLYEEDTAHHHLACHMDDILGHELFLQSLCQRNRMWKE